MGETHHIRSPFYILRLSTPPLHPKAPQAVKREQKYCVDGFFFHRFSNILGRPWQTRGFRIASNGERRSLYETISARMAEDSIVNIPSGKLSSEGLFISITVKRFLLSLFCRQVQCSKKKTKAEWTASMNFIEKVVYFIENSAVFLYEVVPASYETLSLPILF